MTFHKAKEESKWKQWKEQEERILRKSGVSEEVIQRLRELDWQDFNAERRFWEHFSSNQEELYTREYMLLAMEQRQNEDQRPLGELFFFLVDEMADITFYRSLSILMDAFMASLQELLKLSDEQLARFTADFESRLPEYLRNALHPLATVA